MTAYPSTFVGIVAPATTTEQCQGARLRARYAPVLARTGQPTELSNWVRLLDAYRGPTWTVSSFTLVQSRLGEGPHSHAAPRNDERRQCNGSRRTGSCTVLLAAARFAAI